MSDIGPLYKSGIFSIGHLPHRPRLDLGTIGVLPPSII
jgi:hypothetical protein